MFSGKASRIVKFQFQSGAVKRKTGSGGNPIRLQFQFQSGAVKSSSTDLLYKKCDIFQFQSGAVKRSCGLI